MGLGGRSAIVHQDCDRPVWVESGRLPGLQARFPVGSQLQPICFDCGAIATGIEFSLGECRKRGIEAERLVEGEFRNVPGFEKGIERSEEHTSELQSLMRISYAVFCLKKKKN